MESHTWEVILALSATISTLAGGIIRYLLKELSDAKEALKKLNEANAELAKMVPALLEESRKAREHV
jgi:membrane protein YqaA with SNARE-associated domain